MINWLRSLFECEVMSTMKRYNRLSEEDRSYIRVAYHQGIPAKQLAKDFEVSRSTVYKIIKETT